jgi:hypothetical protein
MKFVAFRYKANVNAYLMELEGKRGKWTLEEDAVLRESV